MKRSKLITVGALLGAIALAGTPAFADKEGSRGARGSEGSERARERSESRGVVEGRAVERVAPRDVGPRPELRNDARDQRWNDDRYRRDTRPVIVQPRVVRPYVVRPYVARPYAVRPYYVRPYVFRPRVRIGLGFFVGYPVPYAYAYPYPVPVYGYAAPTAPVYVGPNSTMYGGVSLEITPSDAAVYVDGQYAGTVQDFDGTQQTLTLATGRHRIEIDAPGFEPMTFDVDTVPGEIVPYRGDLIPTRY